MLLCVTAKIFPVESLKNCLIGPSKISVPIKYIGTNIAYVIEKILNDN